MNLDIFSLVKALLLAGIAAVVGTFAFAQIQSQAGRAKRAI